MSDFKNVTQNMHSPEFTNNFSDKLGRSSNKNIIYELVGGYSFNSCPWRWFKIVAVSLEAQRMLLFIEALQASTSFVVRFESAILKPVKLFSC